MIYKISSYTIQEQGRRRHQEDALFPAHSRATSDDRLFILCDGTGDENGAKASNVVCQALSKALLLHSTPDGAFSDAVMQQAITSAYNSLDSIADTVGDGVGTTLAVIKFHDQGATVAYIGSSRIYHVRPANRKAPAQLLFRSNSPVQGEPTVMKPRQKVRARIEIAHIQDIQPDDYFFLVSDGMLEFIDDERVLYNLTKPGCSDRDKVNIFLQATLDNKDNHSAHFIHVTSVRGRVGAAGAQEQSNGFVDKLKGVYEGFMDGIRFFEGKRLNTKGYIVVFLCVVLFLLIIWTVWSKNRGVETVVEEPNVEVPADDNNGINPDEEVSVEDFGIDENATGDSLKNDPGVGVETFKSGTATGAGAAKPAGAQGNTTKKTTTTGQKKTTPSTTGTTKKSETNGNSSEAKPSTPDTEKAPAQEVKKEAEAPAPAPAATPSNEGGE